MSHARCGLCAAEHDFTNKRRSPALRWTGEAPCTTTFVSAEASVYAEAQTFFASGTTPPMTRSDFSNTARRLAAEADVMSGDFFEDLSGATVSALADFAPDGSQGMLSVGYHNLAGNFAFPSTRIPTAEVRYSFLYRFEIDTTSRFIGDWTVGFPQDVTIALAGPSALAGPLPAAFGSHSLLLQPGRYELTFSARDFDFAPGQAGYHIAHIFPRLLETRGFDIYTFMIFETVAPPVPESATGLLAALGAGWLGMVISRRRCRRAAA